MYVLRSYSATNDGEPEIGDHLQDDIDAEDILDDVLGGGDVIDDFHNLKGMISGALGSLGYKFSILVVILFNFAYTAYNAFARSTRTETSVVSLNCSCDLIDRAFYRSATYSFTTLWVLFLVICAVYNIWNCCTSNHDKNANSTDSDNTYTGVSNENADVTDTFAEDFSKPKRLIPDKNFWFLKREFKKLIAMVLSLNIKSLHSHKDRLKKTKSIKKYLLTFMDKEIIEVPDSSDHKFNFAFKNIFKLLKCMLVVIQFFLRLLIVPLLLVQWLDEYSWNCVVGLIKDYCKETTVDYTFDQSMVISFLYTCVLLSIIIGIFIKTMPVKVFLSKQHPSWSKWCLPFHVNHTLFLTNVSFILIVALIYTSILSQFSYVAAIETERDINSGRTFNFGRKWFNHSITGGVSNSVLWKCSEESSANNLKFFFLTLLTFLIIITILYAAVSLVMTFFNFQKFNELIYHYCGARIKPEFRQHANVFNMAMILHYMFQQTKPEMLQNKMVHRYWNNANVNTRNSHRWCSILFLIPAVEFMLILILFLLILTSYNVYPIGCFFTDVQYDESTSTVMLDFTEGVYTYQQAAVVTSIIISLTLIFIRVFHICLAVTHRNQIDNNEQIDYDA